MSASASPAVAPAGYLSADAKRRYTVVAGVLGAVFFVLQFALPFIFMLPLFFLMMPDMAAGWKFAQAERGACWDGRVWFVEESFRAGPTPQEFLRVGKPQANRWLKSASLTVDEPAREVASLDMERPWLLAAPDRLWLISPGSVASFSGGEIKPLPDPGQLGELSRPFLYDGRPAVIEHRPEGHRIRVLENGRWQAPTPVALNLPDSANFDAQDLQVVPLGKALHLFLRSGDTLYYRVEGESTQWQPVHEVHGAWMAAEMGGRPVAFFRRSTGSGRELVGFAMAGATWKPFFSNPVHVPFGDMPDTAPAGKGSHRRDDVQLGVWPTGGNGFVALVTMPPFSLRVIAVDDGRVVSERRLGGGFGFPKHFPIIFMVPQVVVLAVPLVLAFILSALMKRYRAPRYVADGAEMPYATLWRRALAEVIDAAILGWPLVLGLVAMFWVFSDIEATLDTSGGFPVTFFLPHLVICAGVPWALAVLLVYSFLEGRWGATPGKWLLGIRVMGTDLKPCGFGRALVRNLLKFVDGFFYFLVGVLLVALTENRQRLGDLAARTVVISARVSSPPPGSAPPVALS